MPAEDKRLLIFRRRIHGYRAPVGLVINGAQQVARAKELAEFKHQMCQYMFNLVVPGHGPSTGGCDPLLHGVRDPADECAHGRLPNDNSPACGCWREG